MLEKYGRFFLPGHRYPNNKVNPEDILLEERYMIVLRVARVVNNKGGEE